MSLPTPPREPDSVPILNSTPLPAFAQAWQLKPPKDAQILAIKGTFDLVMGGFATPAEEQELPLAPVPFEGSEAWRYPGDMAFFKPRCDVFLVGHAYGPPRAPFIRRVHLELGRALAFSLAAMGERHWKNGAPSAPIGFDKVPLIPERAYGGPDDPHNPLGVGRHAQDGSPLPSLEHPDRLIQSTRDRPAPALTTPIPETWVDRRQYAGTYGGSWAKKRAPYFPDDFRWDYFQAAPPALQIPYPRGDEHYRLRGVRPGEEALEGRLPGLRMRAFAQPISGGSALTELPLNLDTVWFDADQLRVVLVWRGAIAVKDQYGSDLASFFVLAEPIDAPCDEAEIHRRFRAAYALEHERTEPEAEPEPPALTAPEGFVPPIGLRPSQARALGLPPWAATVVEAPIVVAPPPPPSPAMPASEMDALMRSDASLAGADLSYSDLRGRDLSGRDLSEAVLVGAKLDGTRLIGTILRNAILTEASLAGCDLSRADLAGAVLDKAELGAAILDGAILTEASLQLTRALGASFRGANLDGVVAYGVDWTRAKLDGASLVDADFTDAILEDATFLGATMDDVRLYGAKAARIVADDATLGRCRLDGAMLAGGSFLRVKAADSSMRKCDLSDSAWMEAVLEQSVLEDTVLDRANMNQIEAKDCRWPRARAREATFVKANLMGGYFEGAHFADCDMRGANLYEAETFRSRFDGCRFEHAILGHSGLG